MSAAISVTHNMGQPRCNRLPTIFATVPPPVTLQSLPATALPLVLYQVKFPIFHIVGIAQKIAPCVLPVNQFFGRFGEFIQFYENDLDAVIDDLMGGIKRGKSRRVVVSVLFLEDVQIDGTKSHTIDGAQFPVVVPPVQLLGIDPASVGGQPSDEKFFMGGLHLHCDDFRFQQLPLFHAADGDLQIQHKNLSLWFGDSGGDSLCPDSRTASTTSEPLGMGSGGQLEYH